MSERDRSATALRVVVQPYATALPLGCFAFGIGNVIYAAFAAHWLPKSDTMTVAMMMLAFIAPLELISCAMAFLSRDTGAATAMGIFAGAWVVLGLQLLRPDQEAASPATGIFLLLLGICLAILATGTFAGKPLIGALFCVAMMRSFSGAIVQFGITGFAEVATVVFGMMVAFLAFYSALGLLLEDVLQRPLAMMFRSGKAKKAMIASLSEQLENVAREAGVRQQL